MALNTGLRSGERGMSDSGSLMKLVTNKLDQDKFRQQHPKKGQGAAPDAGGNE